MHKSSMARVAYCICFYTLSSSSKAGTTLRNVSGGCRKNLWFLLHHPEDQTPRDVTGIFLKAALQESFLRKIVFLIVIHAKTLGQSYFSSTMQLITAWGCA